MSDVSGGELLSHKRNVDSAANENDDMQNKRQKTEELGGHDDQLNDIFNDPLPGFGGSESNSTPYNDNAQEGELGPENFDATLPKEGDPLDIDFDNLPTNFLEAEQATNANNGSQVDTPSGPGSVPNMSVTTNSASMSASPNNTPRPTPLSKTNSRSETPVGNSSRATYDGTNLKQEFGINGLSNKQEALNRYSQMPPTNRMNHLAPQPQGIQGLNTSSIDRIPNTSASNKEQLHTNDPSKLNDALAAAGVDIQHEEELLMQQHLNRSSRFPSAQQPPRQRFAQTSLFSPYHVAAFMQRVARENGVMQNFYQDAELLELMSTSCENWLSNIITKTIILSRHRRRGIPTITNTKQNKKTASSSASTSNPALRSELSKELRNLAAKQKEMEERRVSKRMALGLEKDGTDPGNGDPANGKAGAEETLHRAANATAAMMTMNPGRKKYSWMTANAGSGGGDDSKVASEKDGKSKQSSIIAARGDNGLRFREIRSGNSVTMKDLLGALEDERMGTEKAVLKGYAKLKD